MSLYDLMEETVNKICKSLEEESHKWIFETCTFTKKGTGIEYWCSGDGPVVDIWSGSGRNQVFSSEQGNRIRKSYHIARQKQASVLQEKIISSMK